MRLSAVGPSFNDLYLLQACAVGIFRCPCKEPRSIATAGYRGKIAAHGHSGAVSLPHQVAAAIEVGAIAPSSEKANPNTGPAGGKCFATLQSVEDGLPRVLFRPNTRQPARVVHHCPHR